MKREEKDFIRNLPEKYRPRGAWTCFWSAVLYTIPLIGWICLLVHAISGKNVNRRSFARMYFCGFFLGAIIFAVFAVLLFVVFPEYGGMIMEQFQGLIGQFMPKG